MTQIQTFAFINTTLVLICTCRDYLSLGTSKVDIIVLSGKKIPFKFCTTFAQKITAKSRWFSTEILKLSTEISTIDPISFFIKVIVIPENKRVHFSNSLFIRYLINYGIRSRIIFFIINFCHPIKFKILLKTWLFEPSTMIYFSFSKHPLLLPKWSDD